MKKIFKKTFILSLLALTMLLLVAPVGFSESEKDGIRKEYNDDGKLKSETTYENGKKNGPFKLYSYEKGKQYVHEEGTYKDGEKEGIKKSYYPNGKLRYEISYRNGSYDGRSVHYHSNGKIRSDYVYKKGFPVDGVRVNYHSDGKVSQKLSYKNGQEDGVTKWYYGNGNIKGETLIIKGKTTGVEKKYYPNGKLEFESFSEGGMRTQRQYNEDGSVKNEKTWDATKNYWAKKGHLDMRIEPTQ
ncbi:toxin-antitoxin system YwqK family antitoxin [Candidatus Omnitrophota bacterium]